jgi:hypothetical protein
MLDFTRDVKLMHRHGSGYEAMVEEREHDAADHDPERAWLHGARIFRCKSCEEEVVFVPPTNEPGDSV